MLWWPINIASVAGAGRFFDGTPSYDLLPRNHILPLDPPLGCIKLSTETFGASFWILLVRRTLMFSRRHIFML